MLIKVRRIAQRCPPATTGRPPQARQQRRRSPRTRRWWLPVACTVVLVAISAYPRATNHQVRIEEAMAGANGDSQIQFVEMRMLASVQNCWGPQVDDAITPGADTSDDDCFFGGANETRSRAMLVFSDAIGREVGRYKFPENPPSGIQRVLIATQAFADLAGAPPPDLIMPPLMNPVNGKVCFKGNGTENAEAFSISLCLSYGNFTGSTEGAGAAAAALSVVNTVSLERQPGTFDDLNSQFSIQNTPTPTNFNGDTFTIPVASQATQGAALFDQETFGGNGRTCASCHVDSLNRGLNPANIQSRFGTVSTTFDPLFVGETAATGFDFNLNTLTLTANSQHQSGTDFGNVSGGDLQGVITSAGLPKGKVLGRANGSYLIHGGFSPAVAGTVTDENGNQGTVNTVVQGGLNALETPSRMRTSASASFTQGRGLILENIDGFANPPVFRKSPHLLNLSRTAPFGLSGEFANTQLFATGAVMQHLPRTLARLSTGGNPDFRLPTAEELVAMEAFMLAREFPPGADPDKFDLDRFALTAQQQSGRTAFFGAAKCSQCHGGDVLALTTVDILGKGIGVNAAFDTGVFNQPINGAGIDNLPCEPSVGMCGTREFSTPQLFNVKNLAPFFHDASAATLAEAIDFYNSPRFSNSPAGMAIGGIAITAGTIADIQAFLEGLVGITGIVPVTGDVGGGTGVTISGTNFVIGATVSIGGVEATNVVRVNMTTITATTPAHAAGLVDVVVTNPGETPLALTDGFTFAATSPTVSSIVPTSGSTAGGTIVTITGTNFVDGATVSIGGVATTGETGAETTSLAVIDGTTITAVTGARGAATVDVVVTNPDMLTGMLTNGFVYLATAGTAFTDDPLGAGTQIKAAHFNELRDRINEQLQRFLQPVHSFTNAITAGAIVRAADLLELYTAVNNALTAAGQATISVPTITAGVTTATAAHINDLRAAVLLLEAL